MAGNRGLAGLVSGALDAMPEPRRLPRTGILEARDNRLSELAAGVITTRQHEAVDPSCCRIWEGHNRDYAALDERACADLIESLRAQGRQEIPAIVRRIAKDEMHKFEVVCGARRHWSVTWLRAHDYPDFKFLVEPREMTDEEAFRVADLENRSRKDLSDYERATDYARAVDRYYGGNQQRMVDRLHVTKSWLSRYLELARLPKEVLDCFESPHVIGISHAASLAPRLNDPRDRRALLSMAAAISAERAAAAGGGGGALKPFEVVARLLCPVRASGRSGTGEVTDVDGTPLFSVTDRGARGLVLTIPKVRIGDGKLVSRAVEKHLAGLAMADDKGTHGGPRRSQK